MSRRLEADGFLFLGHAVMLVWVAGSNAGLGGSSVRFIVGLNRWCFAEVARDFRYAFDIAP